MVHESEHSISIEAAPKVVFDLIADVARWPAIFPPSIHVERRPQDGSEELIRIWATANDQVKTWVSRRFLDPAEMRVRFRQEVSQPPVAAMGGEWIVEQAGPALTRVRLTHDFRAVDDAPNAVEWISTAVDRNSAAELGALKRVAESADLFFTFQDTVHMAGPVERAYDFIYQAGNWPARLSHVARVDLREEVPNTQILEMDTRTKDGTVHTTRSVRICFPMDRIVYKQLHTPALLTTHIGAWTFRQDATGVNVTSSHTVEIKSSAIASVLGESATVDDAKDFVRNALSTNSLATLGQAKAHAERGTD
jgi:aromatase